MVPEIPVVGSVAITWNWTRVVRPDVVVKRPLLVSMLTFGMTLGLVLQSTEVVRTIGCPLAVPVATNCSLLPYVMLVKPSWDVTWMEAKFATITVTVALPVSVSAAQAITLCPGPDPVTRPVELTVATVGLALLQKTFLESFFCEPSL